MSGIKYYYSSVAGNLEIKKNQQRIEMVLCSKKIAYEKIDMAADEEAKKKMKDMMKDPKGLPPQLFNDEEHCGDFDAFEHAVECEELEEFLKIKCS